MKQLIQFFTRTGRNLRALLAKLVSNFMVRGEIAFKIGVKLPLLFEASLSVKSDWDHRNCR
jgi:hypothetical protein